MNDFNDVDKTEKLSLDQVIAFLKAAKPDASAIPYPIRAALANLSPEDLAILASGWSNLELNCRQSILEALIEESEERFDLDYNEIGYFALNDPAPSIRQRAIDLLSIDESPYLMRRLKEIAQGDDAADVRAAAVSALGSFVLLGEYEEIDLSEARHLVDMLNGIWFDEAEEWSVRRRALESLGNSSAPGVYEIIADAYDSPDPEVRASAVFAMGRTCDRDRWGETVRRELSSTDDMIRYEAVRAAGELELRQSVTTLNNMALNDNGDIRKAAIWSLGEIGGPQAQRYLSTIAEIVEETSGDAELEELILEAIENATLPSSLDLDDEE